MSEEEVGVGEHRAGRETLAEEGRVEYLFGSDLPAKFNKK